MKSYGVLALLLLCFCVCSATQQCNIQGQWRNNLGSNMTIQSVSDNGAFAGVYLTAVSSVNTEIVESPLTGFWKKSKQPIIGFAVKWAFSDSLTVWAGQCFLNENNEEVLHTTWLLRSKQEAQQDNWKATRIGVDTFTRLK
ncbi:avidin [Xenopus laevis]|uniref:Avidin n=2 Tax=Xenopus laevis TaxID=8355 RepID=A0A1L8I1W5_XENLA|nr:avidin [Xenopus laevis]OCU02350.1 hypothetical protein XELAEV_18008113mg [Xenopus laevis]